SINEDFEDLDTDKVNFYGMLDDVMNKNIVDFKDKFNEVLKDRLYTAVENLKTNMASHVFEGTLNEISSELLGRYIKKASQDNRQRSNEPYFTGANKTPLDLQQKRENGINLATDKLVNRAKSNAIHASIHPNDRTGMDERFNENIIDESAFSRLQTKLKRKGMSAKEAGGIAYNTGKAKYGKKGMERRAER